ncbi:MAG: 50S ribosomal protein L4 [Ignavibacteriae bacterium]|nr:50S ribosomal protein L4 [Ignavibacteriota bacterium]MCB9216313.1 50S ribosomal protein L4 [Ignavibacteria bacterium]
MKVDILGKDGSKKGSIDLSPSVFGIEPNVAVMHQAVKMHLANRRQGTHKAKERSEVRGGGKKPWRQKGRGVARAGTSRSPLWVGGGTIFGPRPHSYRQAMPKKMRRLARRSALSLKAQSSEVYIVENLSFDQPKTGMFASMLKAINISGKKTLLLTATENETVLRSGRNIPNCFILEARNASTYDLLNNQVLLIEEGAIEVLHGQLVEEGREMVEAVDFDGAEVEEELLFDESGDDVELDEAADDDETGTDDEEEKE